MYLGKEGGATGAYHTPSFLIKKMVVLLYKIAIRVRQKPTLSVYCHIIIDHCYNFSTKQCHTRIHKNTQNYQYAHRIMY